MEQPPIRTSQIIIFIKIEPRISSYTTNRRYFCIGFCLLCLQKLKYLLIVTSIKRTNTPIHIFLIAYVMKFYN